MVSALFVVFVIGAVLWDLSNDSDVILWLAVKGGLWMGGFTLFGLFAYDLRPSQLNWRWAFGPWAVLVAIGVVGRARGALGPEEGG